MNCTAFEQRLERYQAGTLPEAERREIDRHLCHCAACRTLLEVLLSSERQTGQVDLSQAVLSQTIGSACGKCRSLLGDLLDGTLDGIEGELIMSHVDSCASCGSLFRVMSEMAEVLPRMREMEPDASFVSDILRSTRALKPETSALSRILDFLRRLMERPRFSWEAAYLGTLLVFALFGTPFSPVHDAGSRLLASLQNREGLLSEADISMQRWQEDAKIAITATERAKQTVSRMAERSEKTGALIIAEGRDYLRLSEDYLASGAESLQTRIADVFRHAKGSKAGAKGHKNSATKNPAH